MNQYESRTNHLKKNKTNNRVLKQNVDDIKKFYKFLGHKTKTNFQVFLAMTHIKSSTKPSSPSKQSFVSNNDIETLLQLCNSNKLKGVICLGINERPKEQKKITDKLPKINVILFDIDVRKAKKINGISPLNLKKESKEVMERCKTKLEEFGFVVDLTIDSGNGYHIYIKVGLNIPNYTTKKEFEESSIYKRLVYLETQLREFNTKNVEIDFLSKDIIRRVKIPGTYNVKRYKDIDGKFKLMPKEQWRIAKILYLNENINEERNNKTFMNLPLDYEVTVKEKNITGMFEPKKSLGPDLTTIRLKDFNNLLEKDEKLRKLYNGEITFGDTKEHDFKSRSEAEMSLITKLISYKVHDSHIREIMKTCKIGKWQETSDAYKITTMNKAFNYAQETIKKKRTILEENGEISAVVKESEDAIYQVICTKEKLIYRRTRTFYNQKTQNLDTKTLNTIIINEPFSLKDIYYDPNLELFYEVKIGNETVCYNKRDLLNFIENERNYGFVVGRQLKECISVILREFEKNNRLEPKEMYFTLGVFTDKNDDLIVVHPDNKDIKIYGVNAFQKRTIERVKRKGLDMDGMLLKEYFQLLHYPTFPENVRLTTFGHSLIANFFNVLREDIDIFPSHYYIASIKSVGKTALFRLVYAKLFGVEMKSGDDVGSIARFSENCTDTTTCMPIDDIDKLDPKVLNQIKTAGTTLKAKERMTKDQKAIIQDTYRAFSGTANSDDFISGEENEALRGRCLISRDFIIIDDFKELKILEEIKEIVKSNRIIGYFILKKSIEYINKTIDIDNISSHDKLIQLIRQNKEILRKYFESKTIFDDPRRLTTYALLYTSWQMWFFIFQEAEMRSDLLEEILSYEKNNKLLEYIQKYEESILQMNIDDVLNILEFYEEVKNNNGKIRYENKENLRVLDTLFVNNYDQWAKIHGYKPLNKLTKLGEILSKVLKKDMSPKKSIRVRRIGTLPNTPYNKIHYCIPFNEKEIYVRMGMEEFSKEIYNRIIEFFDDNNTDKLDVNNIIQILALDYQEKEIKNNINAMILHGKFTKILDGETIIIKKI